MNTIVYTYRGGVERGTDDGYKWQDGYSETNEEGKITYPWMTRGECLKDAKVKGCKAEFLFKDGKNI